MGTKWWNILIEKRRGPCSFILPSLPEQSDWTESKEIFPSTQDDF